MAGLTVKEQLYHFVDDLEKSLSYDPGEVFDCDNILLCGVGGSAVSGDFAADCCYAESSKYLCLMKYPELPSWVGPRTLAIVSSYSGNTAETMNMYHQAKARGCRVVALTSGGLLREAAESGGDKVIPLPKYMHPRHAIGYMIGYTLAVIRSAGGPDLSERIRAFIPSLRDYRDEAALAEGSLAHDLADTLVGKVPVVCSDVSMQSVAFRWKTQVNENSKFVAFCESLPELGCPEVSRWADTDRQDYLFILLIGADDGLCRGTVALEGVAEELETSGAPVKVIRLGGGSALENMFRAIILGDYMSLYMAEHRGIDPAEVKPVMQLKAKLGKVVRERSGSLADDVLDLPHERFGACFGDRIILGFGVDPELRFRSGRAY